MLLTVREVAERLRVSAPPSDASGRRTPEMPRNAGFAGQAWDSESAPPARRSPAPLRRCLRPADRAPCVDLTSRRATAD